MSDLYHQASLVIGFGAGFLAGAAAHAITSRIPERQPTPYRGRLVTDEMVNGKLINGKMPAFDMTTLIRTQPHGFERVEPAEWSPDQNTLAHLHELIRRECRTGIPPNGIRLSARKCAEVGITRATWGELVNYVMRKRLGYRRAGSVWLNRVAAARFVEWARRMEVR